VTLSKVNIAKLISLQDEYTEVWPSFAKARSTSLTSEALECVHFIQSKLADCDLAHEDCKRLGAQSQKPRRLLRIHDSNVNNESELVLLETMDVSYRYVALSHCWGSSKNAEEKGRTVPRTTKANLDIHQSCGLLVASLTRTFQHAIDLTRKLGTEYIWIDSLCIVQDDEQDKTQEIPKMGDIYGDADLVIAATLAGNGGHGLYHDRRPSRIEIPTSKGKDLVAIVFEKSHHDVWKKGEQFWAAPELPLLHRAWAFQERMLAKRVVHFTPYELIWECRSSVDCECGDLHNPQSSWSEFGVGKNLKTKYGEVVKWGSDMDRVNFWHDICAQYSARTITYASDRLPALSSIAREINMPDFLGRYLAGIWECTLPGGLLWWSEYTSPAFYPGGTATHQRARQSCVPSWSWLSIDGRVSTWGRCIVSLVCILHIQYIPSQGDEYGSCLAGAITVSGKTILVEVTSATLNKGSREKRINLINSNETFSFITDTSPFELSDEDLETSTLLALEFAHGRLSYVHAIIMRLVPGSSDQFERLGIAECPSEWFTRQPLSRITLI
jgi:hypothetical protein